MPIVNESTIVPYQAEAMYALVDDIKSYPEFVPWCKRTEELSRNEDEVRATIILAGAGFEKSFSTVNRLQQPKMIEIRLLDGPFKQLEGFWRFETLDEGSKVSLDLEFEFKSRLAKIAFGPVFTEVTHKLITAFTDRAKAVYG